MIAKVSNRIKLRRRYNKFENIIKLRSLYIDMINKQQREVEILNLPINVCEYSRYYSDCRFQPHE